MANMVQSVDGGYTSSDTSNPLAVAGRPANSTPYTIGDLIANSVTAGLVVPFFFPNLTPTPGSPFSVTHASVRKSTTTLTAASLRLHLFSLLPVVSVGDNGVFNNSSALALADLIGHIGYIDMTFDFSATSGAKGRGAITSPAVNELITAPPSGGLWGLLEDRGGYTPGSGETFIPTIHGAR